MAKAAKNIISLAALVAATQSSDGMMYTTEAAVAPLVSEGLAEINTGLVNPNNAKEFAARATPAGMQKHAAEPNKEDTSLTETPSKPTFARISIAAAELPKSTRGGGGQNLYPFDDLIAPTTGEDGKPVLDGFFVPATKDKPEPHKSMQSAVSAATRRYATKTGEKEYTKADGSKGTRAEYDYSRKFKLSEYTNDGVKGALISRTA